MELPRGTVTFLLTDIEASTREWERRPDLMAAKLPWHDALIRSTVRDHHGVVVKGMGDGFLAAFASAPEAAAAALAAQRALTGRHEPEGEPVAVRMALHTGVADIRDDDYFGPTVNRVARLLDIGHGGQILLSGATAELLRDDLPPDTILTDLSDHRLQDLLRPEHVFQLSHPALPHAFPPLRSLDALRTNLPQQLTAFIGRETETRQVRALLTRSRLLTLSGPGGCGKTRLALQTAADILGAFAGGVWLADLAPITDPAVAARAVAAALGLIEQPGRPVAQTIAEHMGAGSLLLVLDNCEHVLNSAAHLVARLLTDCSGLHVLATSRQACGVAGEQVYVVPPLGVPGEAWDAPGTLEGPPVCATGRSSGPSRYDALDLFVERARLHVPDFAEALADEERARLIARICRRLDGLPLAIELAAAHVGTMPLDQIAVRLDDRFRLLTKGARTALPRHQTLRAAIDSSYDLLSESERVVFRRLAVFAGGCSLEAAEAVCGFGAVQPDQVLEALTALVDKSMVQFAPAQGRYGMLETLCAYALERLEESREVTEARLRHRDFFLNLAEETAPKLERPDAVPSFAALDRELANLRAALRVSLAPEAQDDAGLRIAAALRRFWDVRGYYREGRQWYSEALTHPSCQARNRIRAVALTGAGLLAYAQGAYEAAEQYYAQSLELVQTLGDPGLISTALNNLGTVALDLGDFGRATELFEQALETDRSLHDAVGEAIILYNLGETFLKQGRLREAREALEASRTLRERHRGPESLRFVLSSLGEIAIRSRRYDRASAMLTEGLAHCRRIGDRRVGTEILERLARVAQHTGDAERGATLLGFAGGVRERFGMSASSRERAVLERASRSLRSTLGGDAFTARYQGGAAMSWDEGLNYALGASGDEGHDQFVA